MAHGNQNPQAVEDSKVSVIEKFIFKFRTALVIVFAIATVFLGYEATHLRLEASFEKMIPTYHPFINNYL